MRYILYIPILIGFGFAWVFRLQSVRHAYDSFPNSATVRIIGPITSEPYHTGSIQIVRVGSISVLTESFPRYAYADSVQVAGTLQKRVTDSGKLELWLVYPEIQSNPKDGAGGRLSGSGAVASIHSFRRRIERIFSGLLPEPQASLLSGVVLGVRREIPETFLASLRRTGTIHVVVASGYNVTVVAGVLVRALGRFLGRRLVIPIALAGIAVYTIMAGADPPIVRAAIMGSLAYIGQFLGKPYHGFWGLLLAGGAMLLVSPEMLFDIGFQLSFAATAGILTLTPLLQQLFSSRFRLLRARLPDEVAVTFAAQIAVLPILLMHFGAVSLTSLLVNVIVAGIIPMIMGMGGLLGLVGLVWMALGQVVALLAWVPLTVFVSIVGLFDRLPVGQLEAPSVSLWWAFVYYAIIVSWIWHDFSSRRLRGPLHQQKESG